MKFISELKRRNVLRMAGLYVVGAWLIVQVAGTVLPMFGAPEWLPRSVVILLAIGFVPALVFAWVFEITPDGLKRDAEVPAEASIAPRTAQRMNRLIVLGLALALAYFGVDKFVLAPARQVASEAMAAAATKPVTPAITRKSIAVLAFADLSPGKDQEYFSDGMAEEILNALAQVKDLKVAGRTSSFSYKGRNVDLREIGKALGVAHILEGSVRKQDNRVRITAQLIQASDGSHLWSQAYDGELTDVFELQEKIARSITDQLQVVLEGEQKARLVPVATSSPEAYALYLQATSIFDRRDGPRMREAVAMLEQAIALDPRYARAYSRLATLYWLLPTYVGGDVAQARERVRTNAQRAIDLDPRLAEPWAAKGMAASSLGGTGMLEAHEDFEKALQLDPDDVTSNFWYGLTLARFGYTRAGVERIEHALAVDPMVPNVMRWRGVLYLRDGNIDAAEQFLKRAQAAGLTLAGRELAEIVGQRGDVAAARSLWKEGSQVLLRQLDGDALPGFSDAVATGLFGGSAAERERGVAAIEAFLATKPKNVAGVTPLWLAQLGQGARAMEVERSFVKVDNSDFLAYVFSPDGKAVRALPEFPAYLRAKGFPALWDKYGAPDMCRKGVNGDYVCQ